MLAERDCNDQETLFSSLVSGCEPVPAKVRIAVQRRTADGGVWGDGEVGVRQQGGEHCSCRHFARKGRRGEAQADNCYNCTTPKWELQSMSIFLDAVRDRSYILVGVSAFLEHRQRVALFFTRLH